MGGASSEALCSYIQEKVHPGEGAANTKCKFLIGDCTEGVQLAIPNQKETKTVRLSCNREEQLEIKSAMFANYVADIVNVRGAARNTFK